MLSGIFQNDIPILVLEIGVSQLFYERKVQVAEDLLRVYPCKQTQIPLTILLLCHFY